MTNYGWLIYKESDAKDNYSYIEWFIGEARKMQMHLELIYRENLVTGIEKGKLHISSHGKIKPLPDVAVMRVMDPVMSEQLELMGIKVFNSSAISRICNHKALTHQYIRALSVPMVDTTFAHVNQLGKTPPLPFPFVVKQAEGKGGQHVYMIQDHKRWKEVKQLIKTPDLLFQTCDVQLGKDVRVFVVGKEIIGAVLRENQNDFRANFKLGGDAKGYTLSENETRLVKRIINAFDFGMVGIDFLFAPNGSLLFNEIEDVVGSRTLSKVSTVNILEKYVKHITHHLNN